MRKCLLLFLKRVINVVKTFTLSLSFYGMGPDSNKENFHPRGYLETTKRILIIVPGLNMDRDKIILSETSLLFSFPSGS